MAKNRKQSDDDQHDLFPLRRTQVIYCGDNLDQLPKIASGSIDLIYIDPPFNSNRNYEVFWGETKRKLRLGSTQSGTAAMSLRDIGKRYGVSLQAIQGIERRALKKVRQAIEREAKRAGCTPLEWLFGEE